MEIILAGPVSCKIHLRDSVRYLCESRLLATNPFAQLIFNSNGIAYFHTKWIDSSECAFFSRPSNSSAQIVVAPGIPCEKKIIILPRAKLSRAKDERSTSRRIGFHFVARTHTNHFDGKIRSRPRMACAHHSFRLFFNGRFHYRFILAAL